MTKSYLICDSGKNVLPSISFHPKSSTHMAELFPKFVGKCRNSLWEQLKFCKWGKAGNISSGRRRRLMLAMWRCWMEGWEMDSNNLDTVWPWPLLWPWSNSVFPPKLRNKRWFREKNVPSPKTTRRFDSNERERRAVRNSIWFEVSEDSWLKERSRWVRVDETWDKVVDGKRVNWFPE